MMRTHRSLRGLVVAAAAFPALLPISAMAATTGCAVDSVDDVCYASPRPGVTGSGTSSDPYGSLDYALDRLGAGDTLKVGGNAELDSTQVFREYVSTTASQLQGGPGSDDDIRIEADTGAEPLVVGVIKVIGGKYVTFDNIDVTRETDTSKSWHDDVLVEFYNGRSWTFRDGEVWNGYGYANFAVSGSGGIADESRDWLVLNNCIHDIIENPTHEDADSDPAYTDHNIYVTYRAASGKYGRIAYNAIFNHYDGAGIKLGLGGDGSPGSDNVTVDHNTIYRGVLAFQAVGGSDGNYLFRNLLEETLINDPGSAKGVLHEHALTGTGNHYGSNHGRAASAGAFRTTGGTVPSGQTRTMFADDGENYFDFASSLPSTPTCDSTFQPPTSSGSQYYGRYSFLHGWTYGEDPDTIPDSAVDGSY